jgi:large subunit ribosomal protein L25
MEKVTLNAHARTGVGKSAARGLRRDRFIPCIIYRKGKTTPIQIPRKELVNFINSTSGEQVLVNLKFSDGESRLAIVKDYQTHPVKGELLHTDFYEVSLTEKLKISVAVVLTGLAIGVKRDGGILQTGIRMVELECLPDRIPSHIEVDVTTLEVNHSVHVSDIRVGEGVKLLTDIHEVLATILLPAKAVAEVAEGEAPAAGELKEPEVMKKGKEEKEEA